MQELHRIGGNRDFGLKGHTLNLKCAGSKYKRSNLIEAWARPISGLGGSPGEVGGAALAHPGT